MSVILSNSYQSFCHSRQCIVSRDPLYQIDSIVRPGIKLGSCGDTELGVLFSNCVVILTHEESVVFGGDDEEEEDGEGDDFQIA